MAKRKPTTTLDSFAESLGVLETYCPHCGRMHRIEGNDNYASTRGKLCDTREVALGGDAYFTLHLCTARGCKGIVAIALADDNGETYYIADDRPL